MHINKIFSTLFILALLVSCSETNGNSNENVSREMPGASPWVSKKSFTCNSQGFDIQILRKANYTGGQTPYKIQVTYHSTISEYCRQSRKDILTNSYGSSSLFRSELITSNAESGNYCDRDNIWITGIVYKVTFPNSMAGNFYVTSEHHDADIQNNTTNINQLINVYNQIRGSNPALIACTDSKCYKPSGSMGGKGSGSPIIIGSRANLKKIKKLLEDDVRYVEHNPKEPKDTSSNENSRPIIIGDPEDIMRINKKIKDDIRIIEY